MSFDPEWSRDAQKNFEHSEHRAQISNYYYSASHSDFSELLSRRDMVLVSFDSECSRDARKNFEHSEHRAKISKFCEILILLALISDAKPWRHVQTSVNGKLSRNVQKDFSILPF